MMIERRVPVNKLSQKQRDVLTLNVADAVRKVVEQALGELGLLEFHPEDRGALERIASTAGHKTVRLYKRARKRQEMTVE
jgi:hypothetical protein